MTEVSQERGLFREAADLAIRLQDDPSNPVSLQMVRAWAARSPEHMATWQRVARIHGMTGHILAGQRKDEKPGGLSRRNFLVGGVLGLGAMGVGSMTMPGMFLRMKADHVTQTAEVQRIDLPDGTVMTLGPESAVTVAYSDKCRRIELLAGMSYFEVATDTMRPFTVTANVLTATALGTAFDVSNDAGFISVSVEHGSVEARAPDSELRLGERLGTGDWITFDSSQGRVLRGARTASEVASWRRGMIIADHESVSAMVAKISRWIPGRVVVVDPFLGERVVSGVFDLSDPLRALEAVARPFGAKVRGVGSVVTVISPV